MRIFLDVYIPQRYSAREASVLPLACVSQSASLTVYSFDCLRSLSTQWRDAFPRFPSIEMCSANRDATIQTQVKLSQYFDYGPGCDQARNAPGTLVVLHGSFRETAETAYATVSLRSRMFRMELLAAGIPLPSTLNVMVHLPAP